MKDGESENSEFRVESWEHMAEPISEDGLTAGLIRIEIDHHRGGYGVGILWLPHLFLVGRILASLPGMDEATRAELNTAPSLPDFLRAELVQCLRFYADKIESGEMDERMKAALAVDAIAEQIAPMYGGSGGKAGKE